MGEAARRKAAFEKWHSRLDASERVIADIALKLGNALPAEGACYRSSFFLKYHLEIRHGIQAQAVVGFVNDGTDNLYSSHAWLSYADQLTDIAISRPLRPEVQRPGPVVVCGHQVRTGWTWSYHVQRPPDAFAEIQKLLSDEWFSSAIAAAESLHVQMAAIANNNELIRADLDAAPDGLTYETIARRL